MSQIFESYYTLVCEKRVSVEGKTIEEVIKESGDSEAEPVLNMADHERSSCILEGYYVVIHPRVLAKYAKVNKSFTAIKLELMKESAPFFQEEDRVFIFKL